MFSLKYQFVLQMILKKLSITDRSEYLNICKFENKFEVLEKMPLINIL